MLDNNDSYKKLLEICQTIRWTVHMHVSCMVKMYVLFMNKLNIVSESCWNALHNVPIYRSVIFYTTLLYFTLQAI